MVAASRSEYFGHWRNATLGAAFLLSIFTTSTTQAAYSLVWSDEFSNFNTANWTHQTGDGCSLGICGWGNAELQQYRASNSTIVSEAGADGTALRIQMTREGNTLYSSRLITQGKRQFRRGRIEARMKRPYGAGLWPAFWMLGTAGGAWPNNGEIDIMEQRNSEGITMGTIHWNGPSGYAYYGGSTGVDGRQWHTYAIEWTDTAIRWFLDGTQFWEANIAGGVNGTNEFHDSQFYLLINFAACSASSGFCVGQNASGTPMPQNLFVDWVRVYQDSAIPGTSCLGCTGSSSGGTSSGSSSGGNLNGTRQLAPGHALGKRMDSAGGSQAAGNRVIQWTANGTGAQRWVLSNVGVQPAGHYNIALEGGANCLDVAGWGTANQTKIIIWPCHGGANQAWNAVPVAGTGRYTLRPAHAPNKCLDVPGWTQNDGVQLEIYDCHSGTNQQWQIQ